MKEDHVLFLATRDYANVGYSFAKCLKAVGVSASALMCKPSPRHALEYQAEFYNPVFGRAVLHRVIKKATMVVWMHSMLTSVPEKLLKGKRQVVFHGGTRYRKHPELINESFNSLVDTCLIQTGELLRLGAKNPKWIFPSVDLKILVPSYDFVNKEKLIIGHFTSRPGKKLNKPYSKGTPLIRAVMKTFSEGKFKEDFLFQSGGKSLISWKKNLQRMSECDIYIESLGRGMKQNKNPHDWSVTALEAAALGCIVITNFVYETAYKAKFGEHGLLVANTRKDLEEILTSLLRQDHEELLELKHKARQWVEKLHSYNVVGKRLKSTLGLLEK